ncbi:MAG: molybdopterin-dependent oxidoreductase, partial [Thiotrichales bacterium]|nr:molybdopterin-dependent oxidoreductase [Thiotrichales bacterium]
MQQQPGLAIGGGVAAGGTNAVDTLVAINALNTLAGNLGKPGGVIFNPEPVLPDSATDRRQSYTQMQELVAAIDARQVDTLILHDTNPVYSLPPAAGFDRALQDVPNIISLASYLDETTAMADLVLPVHTFLEDWGDDVPEPGVGFPIASIAQPVVKPVFDTRSSGDIILTLAHQIGGELPAELPWSSMQDYLKASWKSIYTRKYPQASLTTAFDRFWDAALVSGVLGEPARPDQPGDAAATASRPADIAYSTPRYRGSESGYPFFLHTYLTEAFHDGRGANLPWLQELPDPLTSIVYNSWIELNPETAGQLGIREGDVLEVTSAVGSLQVPAFIYAAIRPDVVAIPLGQGHTHYGRYARGRGVNPLSILAPETDDKSGALALAATRVKIRRTGRRVKLIKTSGVSRTLGRPIFGNETGHS